MILSSLESEIKTKIEHAGIPLKEWGIQINRGVLTGLNEAFIITGEVRKNLLKKSSKNDEIIRPIIRGRDVSKYKINSADLWLINTHNGVKEENIPRIDVKQDYPTIYEYLSQFEKELTKRNDKGDHWTNLRNCAYLEIFDRPKIVYPETMRFHTEDINNFPRFAFDTSKYICDKTIFILNMEEDKNVKYLLAFLNSILMRFLLPKYVSAWDDGGFMLQKVFIEKIPVPIITPQNVEKIESLIDKMSQKSVFDLNIANEIDLIFLENLGFTSEQKHFLKNWFIPK